MRWKGGTWTQFRNSVVLSKQCTWEEGGTAGEWTKTLAEQAHLGECKEKKEIQVERSNVTDRNWPGHNVVGKDEPLLSSKHCWV